MSFDPGALEAAKAVSLGHLLFKTARLLNDLGVARVQGEVGPSAVRAAHMQVLPHIALDGTRSTEIARKMGITKQAVGQLLDDMVAAGVVERVADPRDKRARLVRFTPEGKAGLLVGLRILGALEAELAERVGQERIDRLKQDLSVLLPAVEEMVGRS